MIEEARIVVSEEFVLAKFEGDALPENEIERIKIVDGEIVEHWRIENGAQVEDLISKEVN